MDLNLAGRRAVVTGGSRGIGLAIVHALAAEQVEVAAVARDATRVRAAAGRVANATGSRVIGISADTSQDLSVAAMVSAVMDEFGGVDILVNAAATPNTGAPFTDSDLAREVDVKVQGYLRTIRALAPQMMERGWGRVINVSGIAARQTGSLVGSIRNVAVAAMTKNLADEYGPFGINVTVVHPGLTRTEATPEILRRMAEARGVSTEAIERSIAASVSIGRIVDAAEVADVVTFLASPRSVALNGDALMTNGGTRGTIHY